MTREELLALPAAIDLDTANRALSVGRSTGYTLAKQGGYPVKILRLGTAYRVLTADLLRVLCIDNQVPAWTDSGPPVATDHDLAS
ncbi:hypothetical protein QMK19_25825 [Streptomyces sp. H10-C2]|uniref:hypothetical protein n=1 Tax=unclassified Streptomyces TaxID=2593676 RepID=UPI0024B9B05F|nr:MULTISPECIES: hypothetical protein [unclassified Streptomyces]MDJ0345616.1 hypothetical protein [Streptomyces sp. PH10-H1]MDJ0372981.1 hypothetical protein [Streptomyces sp. H10-C2]